MIKTGILSTDGYRTGELIRILLNHPDVDIKWLHNAKHAGKQVSEIYQGLIGSTDLVFTDKMDIENINVLFLSVDKGEAAEFMSTHEVPESLKIIDLSGDFQFTEGDGFVYGLPEMNRRYLNRGQRVSNPSAVATAAELALLPLAKNLLLNSNINMNVVMGYSEFDESESLALKTNNITVFKPLCNPQTEEIRKVIASLQSSFNREIKLMTFVGDFARGTYFTAYLDCPIELDELKKLYNDYYDDHNFTFIIDRIPNLNDVTNTNRCVIYLTKENNKLIIISAIDNLVKGAAGQAVHNMNLLFGLHELVGLKLKASAF